MKMEMEIHEMEFLVSTRNEQFWKLPREPVKFITCVAVLS